MSVARNAPTMPSTVVSRNPDGVLGPGATIRAMMPATKPTRMIQRMPMRASWRLVTGTIRSHHTRHLVRSRHAALRRHVIDHRRQLSTQFRQQVIARHAGMLGQRVDRVIAKCLLQIVGRDRLVLSGRHPRMRFVAVAGLFELLEQIAETAAEQATGGTPGEQSAETAFQKIAEVAAKHSAQAARKARIAWIAGNLRVAGRRTAS